MLYFGGGYPGVNYPPPALENLEPVPQPAHLTIEIPMVMITRSTTRAALIHRRLDQPMQVAPAITVAMTRGMAERVEIPMRVLTLATLERT